MGNTAILYVLGVLIVATITLLWLAQRKNKESSIEFNRARAKSPFAYMLYRVLSQFPLTKKYYGKLMKKHKMLYPGDDISIARRVSKQFVIASIVGAITMTTFILLSKGNVFYLCLGVWTTMVLFTHTINITFDQMEKKLLEQLQDYLDKLRHLYHDTKLLDTALYQSLENLPPEIKPHILQIYDIVISTDTDAKVDRYVQVAPNRFFMTLAAICASIKEYGDKEVNGDGLFNTNINHLKEEVNIEILKNEKVSYMFSGLVFVSLAPVFLLKPVEKILTANMAEMASYYNGAGGTISTIMVFLTSYICYQLIITLKQGHNEEEQDHAFMQKLSNIPIVQSILIAIENHNYSKTLRIADDLKMTGDKIGTRAFLLKRFLTGIGFVLLFNAVSCVIVGNQRSELKNDFVNAFENSVVPNEDYRIILEETAAEYTAEYKYMTGKSDAEQAEILAKEIADKEGIKPKYASEIATTVLEHSKKLSDVYYKWWMLLLSLAAGIIGYYVPYLLLKYKVTITKMNMEDEVIQFQTLVLILMYEDGVTINVILSWMERFSFTFKESIRKCIVNLELNQQQALKKLCDSETFPPFKRFVENLCMIDNVGLEGAFSQVAVERNYYKEKRAQDENILAEKKASYGSIAAFGSYVVFLAGHIVMPFLVFVTNMYKSLSNVLNI